MNDADSTWQYWGRTEPYFGVLTQPEFKSDGMQDGARARFFESGQRYVDFALATAARQLDPQFRPTRALDFGCGVGRLALPLARACEEVVGVDVSDGMLAEARANAKQQGISNVEFVKSDPTLSGVSGSFDFLNSLIVFQHIPTPRGEAIFRRLLGLLRDGGVGALHFTYAFGSGTSRARKALLQAYAAAPVLWSVRNLAKGRPLREPMMQMNAYDLNRLFRILQESGCELVHPRFTETNTFGSPFYGVILFFQKRTLGETPMA